MIGLIKTVDTYLRDKYREYGNFKAIREHLLHKLLEESGEYAEAVVLDQQESTRKLRKYGCLDQNDVLNLHKLQEVATEKLHEEAADLLYIALAICRLEKLSIEELERRFRKHKNDQR